jgi:hypothetical protein
MVTKYCTLAWWAAAKAGAQSLRGCGCCPHAPHSFLHPQDANTGY